MKIFTKHTKEFHSKHFSFFVQVAVLVCILSLAFLFINITTRERRLLSSIRKSNFHLENESPYHNTLDFTLQASQKNPKISQAELGWRQTVRKYGITVYERVDHQFIEILQYFPPSFECPYNVERVGSSAHGGEKWICGLERLKKEDECVIYSFGRSEDDPTASFEKELLNKLGNCKIQAVKIKEPGFEEIRNPLSIFEPERVEVKKVESVTLKLMNDNKRKIIPQLTLDYLMKENGHGWIDILKVDFGEYGPLLLTELLLELGQDEDHQEIVLPFGQLHIRIMLHQNKPFEVYIKWFQSLDEHGLKPFYAEVQEIGCTNETIIETLTLDYSFINTRGKHILLK